MCVRWSCLTFAFCAGLSFASAADNAPKPNIIFILADDLGWGDLGCYGNPHIKTPNLDRLAAQGTIFTQFNVCSGVCSPSRTAFMTGHFPARHGVHGHFATHEQNAARGMPNWLDPSAPFLPRYLQSAGYATAHFGKWHLGDGEGAPAPAEYGFDSTRTVNANGPNWEDEKDPYFRARSSALIADEAIQFIERHKSQPFYINVWSLVPHATLNPTEEQMAPYARYNPAGQISHKAAATIYYASVSDLDAQIGRLLDALDEMDLARNTLVMFTSDNGPEDIYIKNASHSGVGSPGPFRGRKRSLYEGGVRMPFIVRWPGHTPANAVDNDSVLAAVDFMPTLCALAGAQLPEGYRADGENVAGMLAGQPRPRSTPLFWEWRFGIAGHPLNVSPILSIRDGNWKLMLNPDRSRIELYDIPNDPMEIGNLASAHPDVAQRLAEKALAWQKELPEGPIAAQAGDNSYRWPKPKEK
ncbi:MAG: Arylsulfatase [candidate division BRC1 bacterium ADurb.BinA364]|nr:MAG: Arylsulfatase [candidate division BRC1 bacterium ADurb.BinA364]